MVRSTLDTNCVNFIIMYHSQLWIEEAYNTTILFELLKTHKDKIVIHVNLTSTFKNNKMLCLLGPETLASCWRAFVADGTTENVTRCIDVSRFIASRYMQLIKWECQCYQQKIGSTLHLLSGIIVENIVQCERIVAVENVDRNNYCLF
jgi:hypothetical protein